MCLYMLHTSKTFQDISLWACCQILKIAGCACTRNAGKRFPPPPRVSDPDMHHDMCVTHVPWCMPGSLTCDFLWFRWRGNVPGMPGACATRNFMYLARGPIRIAFRSWISNCISIKVLDVVGQVNCSWNRPLKSSNLTIWKMLDAQFCPVHVWFLDN